MSLQIPQSQQQESRLSFLFPGNLGIYQTIRVMRGLAIQAAHNPKFCSFVSSQVNPLESPITGVTRIAQYSIHYTDDPESFEYVKDPILVMNEILTRGYAEGDCDDHATFLAAALTCYNIPNSIVALALPEMGEGFNHVVNTIMIDGQENILDTSVKDGYLGYQIDDAMRIKVI